MEVILLQKLENYGGLGDKVNVKPGFARNFLIPTGKAVPATKANIAAFEARRKELEKREAELLTEAQQIAAKLVQLDQVIIPMKAGNEGKLFGSVSARDIAEAITQQAGVKIERQQVRLDQGRIRDIGEYEVPVHLHPDITTTVKISIVAEK